MTSPAQDVQQAFRTAMRNIAATVTIVTAGHHERGHGMTATAVSSVSLDPPSLLVCINSKTLLHDIMSASERFCVNVLAQEHLNLSQAFSGGIPPAERFALGDWAETEDGLKYLASAHARIVCARRLAIPFGTHTVFIGEVVDVRVSGRQAPLLYHDATYCRPTPVASH
ncbi:4-hydroxyphenylacetate 3-monooxygenase reductase component [Pigmentiphaga humi]|uniref:4-hydroxyphenylacetate 3-monooxygenase reductase component n=1 Tax=Pigmentiphaga humi TaxID=2478468 RepID=A0A3P4AVD2_9BURK|nr:flavin reductase family protein [Pigmentiphaga humi]VCU67977.1 4-hydroxyphenylacetate 3-monooxygenase reductase component [Pigmentiphaga humi]